MRNPLHARLPPSYMNERPHMHPPTQTYHPRQTHPHRTLRTAEATNLQPTVIACSRMVRRPRASGATLCCWLMIHAESVKGSVCEYQREGWTRSGSGMPSPCVVRCRVRGWKTKCGAPLRHTYMGRNRATVAHPGRGATRQLHSSKRAAAVAPRWSSANFR